MRSVFLLLGALLHSSHIQVLDLHLAPQDYAHPSTFSVPWTALVLQYHQRQTVYLLGESERSLQSQMHNLWVKILLVFHWLNVHSEAMPMWITCRFMWLNNCSGVTFINLLRSSRYFPFHSAHLPNRNFISDKRKGVLCS